MKKLFSTLFMTFALFSTMLLAEPVLNIDQPIRTLKVTNEQLKQAITSAAQQEGWKISPRGDDQLSATYQKSDYMAKISIRFAPTFYTINYADSTRMRYTGNSIHPTYNRLIKELQAGIIRNLKSGNFSTSAVKPVSTPKLVAAESKDDDAHAKLKKLKTLLDEGLITQKEYDAKRQKVIDTL